MEMMGSRYPPSSAKTSPPLNLDLTLSIGHSSQAPVPKEPIQETSKDVKKPWKLFGVTIDVDNVHETTTSKSQLTEHPNLYSESVMNDAGGDIVGIQNSRQKNPVQADQVKRNFVKELTRSDVNNCCRFMFKNQFVKENVLPLLNDAEREQVHSDAGYYVKVFDVDTETEHLLKFKLWPSSHTYVFTEWSQHFVKRRNLQTGDRISFCWKNNLSRVYFSVLQRASNDNHPRAKAN